MRRRVLAARRRRPAGHGGADRDRARSPGDPRRAERRGSGSTTRWRAVQARDRERDRIRAGGTSGRRPCRRPTRAARALLEPAASATVSLGERRVCRAARPLAPRRPAPHAPAPRPVACMLRSRTERLRFLRRSTRGSRGGADRRTAATCSATLWREPSPARWRRSPTSMREMAATGDLTRKIALRRAAELGRRRRAVLADDLQHAHRFDRPLPARGAQRERLSVAGPAVDGHRARDAQPADDHQGVAAHAAPATTSPPAACARPSPTSTRKSRG